MRDQELVRRFLLEELGEEKAERVEKRLLEDDELFELCEAVEAELLDAAARGELAPAERDRVLKRLASSPQGRARLALARDLAKIADGTTATEPMPAPLPFRSRPTLAARPAFRWAVAACLVALLGGGTWFLKEAMGPNGQEEIAEKPGQGGSPSGGSGAISNPPPTPPVSSRNPEPTPPPEAPDQPSPTETERESPPPTPPVAEVKTVVFQLATLSFRNEGEPKELQVPGGTERVEFQLDVASESYGSYAAVVWRDGEVVWKEDLLEPTLLNGGSVLVIAPPASKLSEGTYKIELFGNPAAGPPEFVTNGRFKVVGEG